MGLRSRLKNKIKGTLEGVGVLAKVIHDEANHNRIRASGRYELANCVTGHRDIAWGTQPTELAK